MFLENQLTPFDLAVRTRTFFPTAALLIGH